jgi:hypothetical protein
MPLRHRCSMTGKGPRRHAGAGQRHAVATGRPDTARLKPA